MFEWLLFQRRRARLVGQVGWFGGLKPLHVLPLRINLPEVFVVEAVKVLGTENI